MSSISSMSTHSTQPMIVLVTGPSRSGKSEWAERLSSEQERAGQAVVYIATSTLDPTDNEWAIRVEHHRQRRPSSWKTLEVSHDLSGTLDNMNRMDCVLIDSLGTWLANCLELDDEHWQAQEQALLRALEQCPATVILVSEETGWGIVPAYPLGRLFRDRLGRLTRQIGAIAHKTYLVTAGFALDLSELGNRID